MPATAAIRDLRNRFPRIRRLLEKDGEVLLTERGRPKYRLVHAVESLPVAPAPVDYWARLQSYQPKALTAAQARALREANRGDR